MDSPIVRVIQHYFEWWCPPEDNGREWIKTLCPFHNESVPSATVSYENNAFRCFACGVKGDVYSLIIFGEVNIRGKEGCTFAEAKRLAEKLSLGSLEKVQRKPDRKSSRRVFGEAGTTGRSSEVRPRVRERRAPWSRNL